MGENESIEGSGAVSSHNGGGSMVKSSFVNEESQHDDEKVEFVTLVEPLLQTMKSDN